MNPRDQFTAHISRCEFDGDCSNSNDYGAIHVNADADSAPFVSVEQNTFDNHVSFVRLERLSLSHY